MMNLNYNVIASTHQGGPEKDGDDVARYRKSQFKRLALQKKQGKHKPRLTLGAVPEPVCEFGDALFVKDIIGCLLLLAAGHTTFLSLNTFQSGSACPVL